MTAEISASSATVRRA